MTRHHPLESLESRIAPAGLVDVDYNAATGELTLTGDALGNEISISPVAPNVHRIEGILTDLETVGTTIFAIGKLTKVNFVGAAGIDTVDLRDLVTLTGLSFDGGADDDELEVDNVKVKGPVELHGGTGELELGFGGAVTEISGNVTIDCAAGAADFVVADFFGAKITIGGSVTFTGGGSDEDLLSFVSGGPVRVGKGINFVGGDGGSTLRLGSDVSLTIGKLATGDSILYSGGGGNDALRFSGGNVTLAGGIQMTSGALNDRIVFDNAAGAVKIGKRALGDSINFNAQDGNDSLTFLTSNLTLAGGVTLLGGPGTNTLALDGPGGTAKIGKLPTGESILFAGGTGADTLSTDTTILTLAGAIDFQGGAGTNLIDLGNDNARIAIGKLPTGESIRFGGGTGNDTLVATPDRLTLAGGIDFAAGDGVNQIEFDRPTGILKIGKLAGGQSILFGGGTGDDDILIGAATATLAGGIEHNAGGGTNDLLFAPSGVLKIGKFGAGQSVLFTGTGDAENTFQTEGVATLAGSVEVTGGTGNDSIRLGNIVRVGRSAAGISVQLTGGDGDDTLRIDGHATLAGSLRLDGGNDVDHLDIEDAETLIANGPVVAIGGAGNDRLEVEVDRLFLASTLTFTGADGDDTFQLSSDGVITGNVIVDLGPGGGGLQQIDIRSKSRSSSGLVLKGGLTIDVDPTDTTADALTITNTSVAKLIDLQLGGGVSTVTVDNLIAGDAFSLDTRGGADVVAIERDDFFGASVIKKLATILTGEGDDQLAIGSPLPAVVAPFPDHSRVRFLGGLTADGGGGVNDNHNDFTAENDFGTAPTITNFELATLI